MNDMVMTAATEPSNDSVSSASLIVAELRRYIRLDGLDFWNDRIYLRLGSCDRRETDHLLAPLLAGERLKARW